MMHTKASSTPRKRHLTLNWGFPANRMPYDHGHDHEDGDKNEGTATDETESPEDSLKQLLLTNEAISSKSLLPLLSSLGFHEALSCIHEAITSENCNITSLDLSDSQLGLDGAVVLSAIIASNEKIKMLDLYRNELGTSGLEEIVTGFHGNNNCRIETLVLRDNGLDKRAAVSLCSVISASNISHLDLSDNSIGPEAVEAIAKCEQRTKLRTLVMDRCGIEMRGMCVLLEAFCECEIETLSVVGNVNSNDHDRDGDGETEKHGIGNVLYNLVYRNKTLKRLDISDNFVGDEAIKNVAQALAPGSGSEPQLKLESLGLARTHHHEGVNAILQVLKLHCMNGTLTLREIDLSGNVLGVLESECLADLLVYTTTVQGMHAHMSDVHIRIILHEHQFFKDELSKIHNAQAVAHQSLVEVELIGVPPPSGFVSELSHLSVKIGSQMRSLFKL